MSLVLLTIVIVGLSMAALGAGVLLSNRCLRGSCSVEAGDGPTPCDTCPKRRTP